MSDSTRPINYEWEQYYNQLEDIRRSGIVNMWGAAQYLAQLAKISEGFATEVLLSWIANYDELSKKYHWGE